MLTWLAPLIVFGLVVFVHELGHFLAAKAMGVYAPRFSIGFGPALWRRRWGETEYVLARSRSAATCAWRRARTRRRRSSRAARGARRCRRSAPTLARRRLSATDANAQDWDPNAMKPFGPQAVPEHRWFESKPLMARLFILIAGVTMNAVLALVVVRSARVRRLRPPLHARRRRLGGSGLASGAGGARGGDSIVARRWPAGHRMAPIADEYRASARSKRHARRDSCAANVARSRCHPKRPSGRVRSPAARSASDTSASRRRPRWRANICRSSTAVVVRMEHDVGEREQHRPDRCADCSRARCRRRSSAARSRSARVRSGSAGRPGDAAAR